MKFRRTIVPALVLCMLVFAPACGETGEDGPNTTGEPPAAASDTGTATADEAETDTGYLEVARQEKGEVTQRHFGFRGDVNRLSIMFPSFVKVQSTDAGYILTHDQAAIGSIVAGNEPLGTEPLVTEQVLLEQRDWEENGIEIQYMLIADSTVTDINERYFHRYVFRYPATEEGDRTVTMTVRYSELDDAALETVDTETVLTDNYHEAHIGALPLEASKNGKPILILGNSFIGTSDIGEILQGMCRAGKKAAHEIVAVSVGYADVSHSWGDYLGPIKGNQYAAVFMCGFYTMNDVYALEPYRDACKISDTPLVIFPAHNEPYGGRATEAYPELLYLDWKGEINHLLDTGMRRTDFCMDDTYKHSTPLAGYVGAHMIYRAVYGEIPLPGNYGALAKKLGDYAETGLIPKKDKLLYYFD